jgi:hypothetical protein
MTAASYPRDGSQGARVDKVGIFALRSQLVVHDLKRGHTTVAYVWCHLTSLILIQTKLWVYPVGAIQHCIYLS